MSDAFRVVVDPDADLRTNRSSDALVGVIYLESGAEAFPGRGWTDFAYPILGWWMLACEQLMNGVAPECELAFMDGPYVVRLQPISDVAVEARCCRRVHEDAPETVLEFAVEFSLLVRELERVCLLLDNACERRGIKVNAYGPSATRLRTLFESNDCKLKPVFA